MYMKDKDKIKNKQVWMVILLLFFWESLKEGVNCYFKDKDKVMRVSKFKHNIHNYMRIKRLELEIS